MMDPVTDLAVKAALITEVKQPLKKKDSLTPLKQDIPEIIKIAEKASAAPTPVDLSLRPGVEEPRITMPQKPLSSVEEMPDDVQESILVPVSPAAVYESEAEPAKKAEQKNNTADKHDNRWLYGLIAVVALIVIVLVIKDKKV